MTSADNPYFRTPEEDARVDAIFEEARGRREAAPDDEGVWITNPKFIGVIPWDPESPERRRMSPRARARVVQVFVPDFRTWSRAGDFAFWHSLGAALGDIRLPYEPEQLREDIEEYFFRVTGHRPGEGGIRIAGRMPNATKGSPLGELDGDFWADTAIPLLMERLAEVNERHQAEASATGHEQEPTP